jgi:hypothetical protein
VADGPGQRRANRPATNANLYLAGTFGSPILGKLYVGDGTGWQLNLAKRVGSTDTDLFAFKDSGIEVLTATGVLAFGSSGLATPDIGISRIAANTLAIGNGTQGNVNASVKVATVILPTTANTLPATIANDTGGGVNVTTNGGKTWEFANAGSLSSPAGSGVQFNGATSGAIAIVATAVAGSNVLTLPAATDTLVAQSTTDTLSNKTLGGSTPYNRLRCNGGSAMVAGNIVPSAGWGTTASVGSVKGTDNFFEFKITSSGTGQSANPTITITFVTTFAHTPFVTHMPGSSGGQTGTLFGLGIASISTTTLVLKMDTITPIAGQTYSWTIMCQES